MFFFLANFDIYIVLCRLLKVFVLENTADLYGYGKIKYGGDSIVGRSLKYILVRWLNETDAPEQAIFSVTVGTVA